MLIFDDREENLIDVVKKGTVHNMGVLVRKGEAARKRVQPWMRRFVINDPHHWVYWSYRFAQQWPRADILDLPLGRDLSTSQPLQIDNTQPTEDLFAHNQQRGQRF